MKQLKKLELDKIICHDVTKPFPLPDESIDMVITSPPYWGLRDYGKNVKSIFGGDPNCKHEWLQNIQKPKGGMGSKNANVGANKNDFINMRDHDVKTSVCKKCGAWQGQLGLECVSDDTEILTEVGWKDIDTLRQEEKIATFSLREERIEYHAPRKIFRSEYIGKMIRINNFHTDQLLTPNHRVLHKNRKHSGKRTWVSDWVFTSASNLKIKEGLILPVAGKFNGKEFIGEDLAELIGWILAEGSYEDSTKGHWRIRIYQSIKNKCHIETIRNLLLSLKIPYKENRRSQKTNYSNGKISTDVVFSISGVWARKIRKIIPNKIPTNDLLFLTEGELKRLYKGLMEGDGSGWSFYQKDNQFKDWFQRLCLHMGRRTHFNMAKHAVESCNRQTTEVSRRNRRNPSDKEYGITEIEYNGRVWCPTIQNGSFIARRKGKIFITGNSHPQMFVDHLVTVCKEIKRVLKKSGSFYLNLGDTYYGSGGGGGDYNKGGMREGQLKYKQGRAVNKDPKLPERKRAGDLGITRNISSWLQPKQLLGIPWRVAIALQNDGWILRNDIIWHKINSMPSSVKDRLNNTFEHVFHFVKARKYYYDLDAIREPHKEQSLIRAQYDFNVIPRAWEHGAIPISGGKDVNIDCHPAGKNPGDIIRQGVHHGSGLSNRATYYEKSIVKLDPNGANPGDILEYNSKYKNGTHGQTPQGFTRVQSIAEERMQSRKDAKRLFPNDPKKQQEYINFIHDHGGSPLGSNPGDVVKHDIAVGRIGNFSYDDPLHTKGYHPSGKNPGDVIQFDEKYWWSFILGKAHSNRFYKKAFEIMKEWMIKNNCFDYAIFYEWYKKEFEGRWESGTLEKGKANYLSDEKRLPFPKPETRFLGDMPGDFWSLTTQPFTGYSDELEHFATFPPDLLIKPLKSSCPKEICKKCGKPRIRIIETKNPSKEYADQDALVEANKVQKTSNPQSIKSLHRNVSPDGKTKGIYYSGKTIGWSDCGCNAGFEPGIVLDPFGGRGTVGKVAKQLGLHYILFDIKPEYCELARLYIAGQKYKIRKGQSKLIL